MAEGNSEGSLERHCPATLTIAFTSPHGMDVAGLPWTLSLREHEVLLLLAAGASNQEIARTLIISLATVKKHVSNLLGKLGASSRTQAIARARSFSLL